MNFLWIIVVLAALGSVAAAVLKKLRASRSPFPANPPTKPAELLRASYQWCTALEKNKNLSFLADVLKYQCINEDKKHSITFYFPSPGVAFAATLSCICSIHFCFILSYFMFSFFLFRLPRIKGFYI